MPSSISRSDEPMLRELRGPERVAERLLVHAVLRLPQRRVEAVLERPDASAIVRAIQPEARHAEQRLNADRVRREAAPLVVLRARLRQAEIALAGDDAFGDRVGADELARASQHADRHRQRDHHGRHDRDHLEPESPGIAHRSRVIKIESR